MDIEVRDGIVYAPGARLIDRTGRRVLPIGRDGFEPAAESFVLVDKTMLIADVLDSGYAATLFCRPRRFGKTLNMTMLRAFLEDAPDGRSRAALFEGTEVWEAGNGCYRKHQGAYPVVHVSFNTVKKDTWEASYGEIRNLVAVEYERHAYLANSDKLSTHELGFFDSMRSGAASDADVAGSLAALCRLLYKHHGRRVVLLVDEYDAPVMAGYSAPGGGYCREVVTFLKVENFRAETPIPHGCSDIPTIAFLGGKSHNQLIEAERRGTEYALLRAGRMSQTITLPAVNAETVGQLLYFFELVTAYTGAMLEIDAFNQPGVEESKIAAYAVMGYDSEIHTAKREEMRACPEGKPEYVF